MLWPIFNFHWRRRVSDAADQNKSLLSDMKTEGMGYLNTGLKNSTGSVQSNVIDPFKNLSSKYGQGTNLYLDSLGVNGPQGNQNATNAFQAGPGYQWQTQQALDGVMRNADAMGMNRGGNNMAAVSDRAGNMANQEYGNWQTRLAGLMPSEMRHPQDSRQRAALRLPVCTIRTRTVAWASPRMSLAA